MSIFFDFLNFQVHDPTDRTSSRTEYNSGYEEVITNRLTAHDNVVPEQPNEIPEETSYHEPKLQGQLTVQIKSANLRANTRSVGKMCPLVNIQFGPRSNNFLAKKKLCKPKFASTAISIPAGPANRSLLIEMTKMKWF